MCCGIRPARNLICLTRGMCFVGAGSMVAAGLVLLLSDRSKAAAAIKQLTLPLLAIIALAVGLAI